MPVALAAFALVLIFDPLAGLEAKSLAADKLSGSARTKARREVLDGVKSLISQDRLGSGSDFRRAAVVWQTDSNDFEDARVRYELVLVATALDDPQAGSMLTGAWDALQLSMGRPQRFGTVLEGPESPREPHEPVSKVVFEAFSHDGQDQRGGEDNQEVQGIVDADQAARQGDFTKMTIKQIEEMVDGDRKRLARIKEIVAGPALTTSRDFFNAALTMQHGTTVMDIVMAHELAVGSVLLGDNRSARWLAAASYDRMLRYGGHRQRFATQYDMQGLQKLDPEGINDRMRKALKCPSLSDAKKRVIR